MRAGRWARAAAAALAACATVAHGAGDPRCNTMAVAMRADALVYRLPRTFLGAGERVRFHADTLAAGTDYVLDHLRGELRLLHAPVPGDTLWVTACGLVAPPPLERVRFELRAAGPDSGRAVAADTLPAVTPRAGVSPARLGDVAGVDLAVSGSKSLAIDFGSNQDAFLRQSLDLTVSGHVAPGVELTGVLSDRNTPLTAEGSTRDLQALDRVLLELRAPQATVQLGDVDVAVEQGEFGRLRRHLQGLNAAWRRGAGAAFAAAATAPGEYHRAERTGLEGFQGPYALDGAGGAAPVVAGSEIVTLDGERLVRGESADYVMDYDAGRITFTNRRAISAGSRIAVQYQLASGHYRRRLVTAGTRWDTPRLFAYGGLLSESDDRGAPEDGALSAADIATLALAGDSVSRAIVQDVSADGGDYDTTRVAGTLVYVYAGPGAGHFAVPFTAVGAGLGDYEPYPVASGTAFRYLGPGLGPYRVGRTLAAPASHLLAQLGAGARAGPLAAEVEGAVSRFDANTFSSLGDGDNTGGAARARLALEAPGTVRRAGVVLTGRGVDRRFAPFERLAAPFEGERWGLAPAADLDRRREGAIDAYAGTRALGELSGSLGRLTTPDGFRADRREAAYRRAGKVELRGEYAWAAGRDARARRPDGSRERAAAGATLHFAWVEPSLVAETDARRAPSDSLPSGARSRFVRAQLASGAKLAWQLAAGAELRRDALATAGGFADQGETRIVRGLVRSPDRPAWNGELRYERRALEPLASPQRTRSDLGGVRLRAEHRRTGLSGRADVEVSGDGENRRERRVVFVGTNAGAYDRLGNFVGTGDYTVSVVASSAFDRVTRAATSVRLSWEFAPAPEWRGSRATFEFESETRRRGDLAARDPFVPPGTVLGDRALARASVRQRIETELAPGARAAAFRLRLERTVSADRAFENFAQTLDRREAALRWRARPSPVVTTELEGLWRRGAAVQSLTGATGLAQTLVESGADANLTVTPLPRLRTAAIAEARWTRAPGSDAVSRTLRIGPDIGIDLSTRAHAELAVRRGFTAGAPAVSLLPQQDPAGPTRWDATARLDWRVRESSTAAGSVGVIDRPGRRAVVTGRAEVRAFF